MCQTCVVLDMPLDGAAVSGLGVPFDASDYPIYLLGGFDEVAFIIGDAGRGSIINHECMGVRVELFPQRFGYVFSHVVVMTGMES